MDIQFKIKKIADSSILYDADILVDPSLQLFDVDYHTNLDPQQKKSSLQDNSSSEVGIGRAPVTYFCLDGKTMVLKHYYRGGLVSSLLKDQYFGTNVEKTRAFKEWCLLKTMKQKGLPVPVAVAAHVKQGFVTYRADLITQKIENTRTLADVLLEKVLDFFQWKEIGVCVKKFHDNNIYHADLNARNILLTEVGQVYLIDFDNSYFRVASESWKLANIARLKRSLNKFARANEGFHFSEDNWLGFIEGYKG